ncbi:MAG: hypothetical protein WBV94_05255 [Blastocatellia bacterium]
MKFIGIYRNVHRKIYLIFVFLVFTSGSGLVIHQANNPKRAVDNSGQLGRISPNQAPGSATNASTTLQG